ncbi:PREDICTED: zinc finger MYM-type protein 1-like [Amphimedon queenslandica]|uniref:DUF4371 domain-containing protein n=1 Tax=Amphimedon queenslandica TaxID=400682 RepID=A0A1X7UAJ0_AMPQE|nr:PREDICTED: zinc finger MYM-type protein 1-like [Amphimedon queenslandica]|eukprot:XP_011405633.1 PREDICTED: zinc finger MYM-type protein 1-like [Amphimedon queenslandica]
MGDLVSEKICTDMRQAGAFSILVDETKDIAKIEQVALVIRYVKPTRSEIHKRFLMYVKASSLNAKSMTEYITSTLEKYHLDVQKVVSQGYDGTSVMYGSCTGVQRWIFEIVPQAIYVHCFAHVLNLVLVDCSKKVSHAGKFFALLESLYLFLSSAKAHTLFAKNQEVLYPSEPKLE